MYFIVSINSEARQSKFVDDRATSTRCFGYFSHLEDAEKAVEENRGNIHECFYDFCVIEIVREGIHGQCNEVQWYQFKSQNNMLDNHRGATWEKCEKPSWAIGICNWSIG